MREFNNAVIHVLSDRDGSVWVTASSGGNCACFLNSSFLDDQLCCRIVKVRKEQDCEHPKSGLRITDKNG